MKRLISMALAAALLLSLGGAALAGENIQGCAVIGADLNDEQKALVYQSFGIPRGSVTELSVTNAEERQYLEGLVDEAIIGSYSISCVYVELKPAGSGMSVTTNNITWCTPEMYISALATAGVTDARIIVAAPVPVSGTAGLTGIYKAYEDMTGQALDGTAKQVGTQELTVTGELAQEIGQEGTDSIIAELKLMLDRTKDMSDEQLRSEIELIASSYGITLTNTQYEQLISLCRALEKLNAGNIQQRVEDVQETIDNISEAKDQVLGFVEQIKNFIESVQGFIETVQGFFGGDEPPAEPEASPAA